MTTLSANSPVVIAEIAQAHDGSLGIAHKMIDCVASAGTSHIKFQMHFADYESTIHDRFRTSGFPQDESRYDYWKRIEFTKDQWAGIIQHCVEKDLEVVVSPFSDYALDLCEHLGVRAIKIGSGEVTNRPFLENVSKRFHSHIISTGLSTWDDIDNAYQILSAQSQEVAILQCTTEYPCPLNKIGLNNIELIKRKYGCLAGLSDHSGRISPALTAYAQGFTDIIELHVAYSRNAFGPDSTSSITFEELASLHVLLSEIHTMLISPTDKDTLATDKASLQTLFGRSLYFLCDLPSGTILNKEHLGYKKPGGYLTYDYLESVIGRRILKNVVHDEPVTLEVLE